MREPAICFSYSALAAFRVTENKIITLKEIIITLTKFIFAINWNEPKQIL